VPEPQVPPKTCRAPSRRIRASVALSAVLLIGGCAANRSTSSTATSSSTDVVDTSTGSPSSPEPTVRVLWQDVSDSDVLRFAAAVTNPGAAPLRGVVVEWTAYGLDDTVAGQVTSEQPVIPAGGTIDYVGGADDRLLTDTPARLDVRVANVGTYDPDADSSFLTVDDVHISNPYGNSYGVTADFTASGRDVEAGELDSNMVVRTADGTIVDADFTGQISSPATLPAGTTAQVDFFIASLTDPPAIADVHVWIKP
jgi:hypothetical protein